MTNAQDKLIRRIQRRYTIEAALIAAWGIGLFIAAWQVLAP